MAMERMDRTHTALKATTEALSEREGQLAELVEQDRLSEEVKALSGPGTKVRRQREARGGGQRLRCATTTCAATAVLTSTRVVPQIDYDSGVVRLKTGETLTQEEAQQKVWRAMFVGAGQSWQQH